MILSNKLFRKMVNILSVSSVFLCLLISNVGHASPNASVKCTSSPILSITFDYGVKPTYTNISQVANSEASWYAERCGDEVELESVRFTLNAVPTGYVCVEHPCYLVMTGPGEIDYSNFLTESEAAEQSPIPNSYMDVVEYLEKSDFTYLKSSDALFKVTYEALIYAYSQYCSYQITDPVYRKVTLVETTQQGGVTVNQQEVGKPTTVKINRRYSKYFDDYFQSNEVFRRGSIFVSMLGGQSGESAAHLHINNRRNVDNYVRGKCGNSNVKMAYANMYKIASEK